MSLLAEARSYSRFLWGLRGYVSRRLTLEEARATIRRRLEQRQANFLHLLEKGIYGHARSPYLPLLRLAQVELGDLRNMLRDREPEAVLLALREAGVYVTFEELKGRQPVVRHGQTLPIRPRDFENPFLSRTVGGQSGGSTGAGTRVQNDIEHLAAHAGYHMLTREAHGVLDVPAAIWRGILPDPSGLNNVLQSVRYGRVPAKWFSQIDPRQLKSPAKYVLATYSAVAACRALGVPVPWPQIVRLDEALVIARWAAETCAAHGACLIMTTVSRGLRVCLAAQQAGLNLAGTAMMIAGEPVTPAKARAIAAAGVHAFSTYGSSEIGRMGMGCAHPADASDVHVLKDSCAIIQYPRCVPGTETSVPAFNVTSLLLTSPKLLLNAELDDFGVIERRACGCALESYGFTDHLREIYSFSKLTGEGVTLIGSDMLHILEEVLPARFGGSALDYQLLEEEDEHGFTRLSLLVSPRVALADENEAIELIADALRRSSVAGDLARATWEQAQALRVKRMEPIWTGRGKLMPLFASRRAAGQNGAKGPAAAG